MDKVEIAMKLMKIYVSNDKLFGKPWTLCAEYVDRLLVEKEIDLLHKTRFMKQDLITERIKECTQYLNKKDFQNDRK